MEDAEDLIDDLAQGLDRLKLGRLPRKTRENPVLRTGPLLYLV